MYVLLKFWQKIMAIPIMNPLSWFMIQLHGAWFLEVAHQLVLFFWSSLGSGCSSLSFKPFKYTILRFCTYKQWLLIGYNWQACYCTQCMMVLRWANYPIDIEPVETTLSSHLSEIIPLRLFRFYTTFAELKAELKCNGHPWCRGGSGGGGGGFLGSGDPPPPSKTH